MKLRNLILLIIFLGIIGCDFKKDEKIEDTTLENSESNKDAKEKVASPQNFESLNQWQAYYKSKYKDFDMHNFKKQESFKLVSHASEVTPVWSPEFKPIYQKFIKYNQDSTKYVDFMSYKLQFDNNNEVLLSPDQEIVLVDIPNRKVESILFYGPSYWIEDAYFKNDSTLVLLENSTDQVPAYQEININTLQSDYYTYHKSLDFSSNYLKEKLLSIYNDNL